MLVLVVDEIVAMALGAGAAFAIIEGGVAVVVYSIDTSPVDAGMAEETIALVHAVNHLSVVAFDAERSRGDGCRMVMTMAAAVGIRVGEVIGPVTAGTG